MRLKQSEELNTQFIQKLPESHGYKELSRLLKLYARNKDEHAKLWFKWINEGSLPSLIECFENALAKEQEKTKELYRNFAEIANARVLSISQGYLIT